MKDNFSSVASLYARFRPTYPNEAIDFIMQQVSETELAWDCATGNGQVATILAKDFNTVYATDISEEQIEQAVKKDNIFYSVQPAEKTNFESGKFDLITVGQAIHWFNFDAFYKEADRLLKPEGVIAVIGYGGVKTVDKVNEIKQHFYKEIVGDYWDKERRYVDDDYQTIPFPFNEIACPKFTIEYEWNLDQFVGYLRTWSAVVHFQKQNKLDPLGLIMDDLKKAFPLNSTLKFSFPILLRVGKKN